MFKHSITEICNFTENSFCECINERVMQKFIILISILLIICFANCKQRNCSQVQTKRHRDDPDIVRNENSISGNGNVDQKKNLDTCKHKSQKNNHLNPNPANSSQSENPAASIYTVAVLKGLELIQKTCFHLQIFFLRYFVNELAVIQLKKVLVLQLIITYFIFCQT